MLDNQRTEPNEDLLSTLRFQMEIFIHSVNAIADRAGDLNAGPPVRRWRVDEDQIGHHVDAPVGAVVRVAHQAPNK